MREKIVWLKRHGSSLVMNWAEDGDWQVDWISSGERRRATGSTLGYCLDQIIASAKERQAAAGVDA